MGVRLHGSYLFIHFKHKTMKIPKSIIELAQQINCFTEKITFKYQGIKLDRSGWIICDADNNELMEMQPVYNPYGDKWKVINRVTSKMAYLKSLRQLKTHSISEGLKPGLTGYKFTSLTFRGKPLNKGIITGLQNYGYYGLI
jgi:hypothetical protein